jgi:Na+-driven multidrug efflux pump
VLPLIILVAGTLAFAVMIVLNSFILGQLERPGLLSIISWLELGVSIPLYIIFITWLGIVGAAIASTITYLIAMVCTLFVFLRNSGLSIGQVMLPHTQDFHDYAAIVRRGLGRLSSL